MKHAILDEVFQRRPPKTLYHYTTQAGILGIIADKGIWLTHTQYLNDHREFLHAVHMVSEVITEMLNSGNYNDDDRRILEDMDAGVVDHGGMNVCVCSFSEDCDSLSQWRTYGSAASGFAIGFNGNFLADAAVRNNFYLAPCIYAPSKQRELLIVGAATGGIARTDVRFIQHLGTTVQESKTQQRLPEKLQAFLSHGKNDLHYCQRRLPFTSSGGRTELVWKWDIRLGCKASTSLQ